MGASSLCTQAASFSALVPSPAVCVRRFVSFVLEWVTIFVFPILVAGLLLLWWWWWRGAVRCVWCSVVWCRGVWCRFFTACIACFGPMHQTRDQGLLSFCFALLLILDQWIILGMGGVAVSH